MRRHLWMLFAFGVIGSLVLATDAQAGLHWGSWHHQSACEPCGAPAPCAAPACEPCPPPDCPPQTCCHGGLFGAKHGLFCCNRKGAWGAGPGPAPVMWPGPASPQWVAPSMQAPMAPSKQAY
jgi:hypothetical protein